MNRVPRFRFAPSPNGELHLGHAYSALFTAEAAREAEGRFILRVEDIDFLRCRAALVDRMLEDLAWLGLSSQEPVRYQSKTMGGYRTALSRLSALGLLYPCFATRQEIREAVSDDPDHPRDPEGMPIYPGLHKHMAPHERQRLMDDGRPYALRLDMERAIAMAERKAGGPITFREYGTGPAGEEGELPVNPARWGDVVLGRKDIGVSYHIAVVVDDAAQAITHVTRGQDLFHATDIHRLLQVLLDLPEPVYRHHGLIGDETGRKLSKSAGDRSLRALREAGVTAEEIRELLGFARQTVR